MPLPMQAGLTALGHWRLRATLIMPALVDDGSGGQDVEGWTTGASFAAFADTETMSEAITVGGALRTQRLLTVLTWFRRDVISETEPVLGIKARLEVTDGSGPVQPYEISGTRQVAGPSGEPLLLALDLVALPLDEPAALRRGAARHG
jgi:hypothetical protein